MVRVVFLVLMGALAIYATVLGLGVIRAAPGQSTFLWLQLVVAALVMRYLWRQMPAYKARSPQKSPQTPQSEPSQPDEDEPAADPANEDRDHWEGSFHAVPQQYSARRQLRFDYTAGDGKVTQRTVDVRQFGTWDGTTLVIGHCHMRNATRTFRTNRMRNCYDTSTGEILSDVGAALMEQYQQSPERTIDVLLGNEAELLRVLQYIAKADGQIRAGERSVILEACQSLAPGAELTDALITQMLSRLEPMTNTQFRRAIGRLANGDPAARSLLRHSAEKMVNSKRKPKGSELDALEYIMQKIPMP